jgi:hypothetical protein
MPIQTSLHRLQMLEREMTEAGDRLRLAIAVENEFNRVNPGDELADLKRQWIECRRIVDQFAEDYVSAVQRWRKTMMDSVEWEAVTREKERKAAMMFHRLLGRPPQ